MSSLADKWMGKTANVSNISSFSISNPPELKIAQPAQAEQLVASSFDSNHWRQQIETAINNAINLDQGALDHCRLHKPKLHTEYMAAANHLDTVYISRDEHNMLIAIQGHNNAFKAVRNAMCESLKVKRGVSDVKN